MIGQIVGKRPLGSFHYEKRLAKRAIICEVQVFLFRVERKADDWPEKGQRDCRWFDAREATALVEEGVVLTISNETRRRVSDEAQTAPVKSSPANDDRKPALIVTARRPGKRYAEVPEVSEEEHRRVGDLADAMMQEFKRKIAEKIR